jgi:hypothetical protein
MEALGEPEITKEGMLSKLGGGAGGHKNWKGRYFVLSDHLYYYTSKKDWEKDAKAPLGRINLGAFFVSKSDPENFEFCVHAYPKVSPSREAQGGCWAVCARA